MQMEEYLQDTLPNYLLGATGLYLVLPMILLFLRMLNGLLVEKEKKIDSTEKEKKKNRVGMLCPPPSLYFKYFLSKEKNIFFFQTLYAFFQVSYQKGGHLKDAHPLMLLTIPSFVICLLLQIKKKKILFLISEYPYKPLLFSSQKLRTSPKRKCESNFSPTFQHWSQYLVSLSQSPSKKRTGQCPQHWSHLSLSFVGKSFVTLLFFPLFLFFLQKRRKNKKE